jgi:hypothetical protein
MSESLLFTELLHVRIDGQWNLTFCSNLLAAIASWLAEGHAYLLDLCNSTDIFYCRHRIWACGGSDESLLLLAE